MNRTELNQSAREVIGQFLAESRKQKGISTYAIRNASGLNGEQIIGIESGSTNYTIDALLSYLHAIDVYVFFADKSGKDRSKPIDAEDVLKKLKRNNPRL